LRILAAYREGTLVGIAPLYAVRTTRRLLPVRSLQFIGTSWRDEDAVISEYLEFLAAPADLAAVRIAFLDFLAARDSWSELIVGFANEPLAWSRALEHSTVADTCYTRTIEHSTSRQADLSRGFEPYLRSLGQSTRRSLWHLRRRLADLGAVRIEHASREQIPAAFDHLNSLHEKRWGSHGFSGSRLTFHRELAERCALRGELSLSLLRIDERVVSVLCDVRKGAHQYNLKAAFDPAVEQGFSLGLIHFGYALESAAAAGVTTYDFLAGHGRHTDFKSHLGQLSRELATVQVLRGAVLRRLYRWHDGRTRAAPASRPDASP
jgi:CelD/BcsL family acetyltransferase involved in cellulose biosynthesis